MFSSPPARVFLNNNTNVFLEEANPKSMKYKPGSIVKYTEIKGFKRTLYGIIFDQLNKDCLVMFTEDKNQRIIQTFINQNNNYPGIKIDEILKSYKDIPKKKIKTYGDLGRPYVRKVAKLFHKNTLETSELINIIETVHNKSIK